MLIRAVQPSAEDVHRRRWAILALLCTSLLIVVIGNTTLNVTLPVLSRELGATESQLQWVVAIYSLVFAGLLFTTGAIGDRFGRKGALQLGLLVFLVGSAVAAFVVDDRTDHLPGRDGHRRGVHHAVDAVDPDQRLPAARTPQGDRDLGQLRRRGGSFGPVVSGALIAHFWWGSVFLINVPLVLGAHRLRRVPDAEVAATRTRRRSTRSARCCRHRRRGASLRPDRGPRAGLAEHADARSPR